MSVFSTPVFFLLLLLMLPACALSDRLVDLGPVRLSVKVTTWQDMLDRELVRQNFDYSCGASSLATVLKYYYQQEVTEADVLKLLGKDYAASFLDLAKAAEEGYGLRTLGLSADFASLQKLKLPVLIYVQVEGLDHFTVLRGIDDTGRVWLADPSQGNRLYSKHQFVKIWSTEADAPGKGRFLAILPAKPGDSAGINQAYFVSKNLDKVMRSGTR